MQSSWCKSSLVKAVANGLRKRDNQARYWLDSIAMHGKTNATVCSKSL